MDIALLMTVMIFALATPMISFYFQKKSETIYIEKMEQKVDEQKTTQQKNTEDHAKIKSMEAFLSHLKTEDLAPQKSLDKLLAQLCALTESGQGLVYKTDYNSNQLLLTSSYAYINIEAVDKNYAIGEGLIGVAAKENRIIKVDNLPTGYITIFSGLGKSSPTFLYIIPLALEQNATQVFGLLELALFKELSKEDFAIINSSKSFIHQLLSQ